MLLAVSRSHPLTFDSVRVTVDVGSFLGVSITAQLRDHETGSFVRPFALFPIIGLLNLFHCHRVFAPSTSSALLQPGQPQRTSSSSAVEVHAPRG